MPTYQMLASPEIIAWLLEGDPAVRWQVRHYLLDDDPAAVAAERARVARVGWGARLLDLQDPAGTWSQALYSPKWTSTHYTLLTLMRLGLPPDEPRAVKAAQLLLDRGFLADHGINYPARPGQGAETCITGMGLALFSYFALADERVHLVAEHLLREQMPDGGWNCARRGGATHASFHTTTSVLEGLLGYSVAHPSSPLPSQAALERGREFLLQHHLYRSHRTGEVVSQAMTRFPFPPFWQHDVLRALDHFVLAGADRDERARDPVELVLGKRDGTGFWNQYRGPGGQYFFDFEVVGAPSRANTFRALRLARWWLGA